MPTGVHSGGVVCLFIRGKSDVSGEDCEDLRVAGGFLLPCTAVDQVTGLVGLSIGTTIGIP